MKFNSEILDNKKWVNAAGTAGYAPSPNLAHTFPNLKLFITNPISFCPRSPAKDRNILTFNGGFLVHNGFPNPGFNSILGKYQKVWEYGQLQIIPSLLSDHPEKIEKMVRCFENIENIAGIELYLDGSNTVEEMKTIVQATIGELPIILCIPYEFVSFDKFDAIFCPEIIAISLQPPRGSIVHRNKIVSGRLYGPAMFPLTLRAISELKYLELPIIAGLGAMTNEDIEIVYESGANNFQSHELIWRDYF